jgi:hypothetical protein
VGLVRGVPLTPGITQAASYAGEDWHGKVNKTSFSLP